MRQWTSMMHGRGISLFDRAVGKARRILAERCVYVDLDIPADFRAVSFCFDEFPATAAGYGASTMESFGLRGTFYNCFGTLGQDSASGRLATLDEVRALDRRGHEIGCHTYDHINCAFADTEDARLSCGLNRKIAAQHGIRLTSFAYPQGGMRAGTKKIISAHYATARCSQRGLNRGVVDAHALRANPIYDHLPEADCRALIDAVRRDGGWLIFYTHDVASAPSRYGASQSRFKKLLLHTMEKNLPILTIREGFQACGRREAYARQGASI